MTHTYKIYIFNTCFVVFKTIIRIIYLKIFSHAFKIRFYAKDKCSIMDDVIDCAKLHFPARWKCEKTEEMEVP